METNYGWSEMKLLLFSDLHSDFRTAARLVELSNDVDVVVGAGDFCNVRRGLEEIIKALSSIIKPAALVPGNSESYQELVNACRPWTDAHVLHGKQATIDGVFFYGIGGGIPITPFGSWSYDFAGLPGRRCSGQPFSAQRPSGYILGRQASWK